MQEVHYTFLNITRVVMHRIIGKTDTSEHVNVLFSEEIVALDDDIRDLIINRLVEAFGRQGKAYELKISNDGENSCFSKINRLSTYNDEKFVDVSKEIAQLLADSQDKKRNVPGGYFLLVEAVESSSNKNIYVILKAEKQDALSVSGNSVKAQMNIFLSPAQKLYKAVVFEQLNNNIYSKDNFHTYLFDSQFNDGTKLAEYFYKDFLGLSIDGNSVVQTKLFYDLFSSEIDLNFKNDNEQRNLCKELLQCEMTNQQDDIDAHEIIKRIIPLDKRDRFIAKVNEKFPNRFIKNTSLIKKKLQNRSVILADSVRLYGPSDYFNNDTITIENDPTDANVKIIKVRTNGREFTSVS